MGGNFVSEDSAQDWVDKHLTEQDGAEIFYSSSYNSEKVTKEWKRSKSKEV